MPLGVWLLVVPVVGAASVVGVIGAAGAWAPTAELAGAASPGAEAPIVAGCRAGGFGAWLALLVAGAGPGRRPAFLAACPRGLRAGRLPAVRAARFGAVRADARRQPRLRDRAPRQDTPRCPATVAAHEEAAR